MALCIALSDLQPGVEKRGSGRSVTALKGFEGEPSIMSFR
jgi:hypothetical protein